MVKKGLGKNESIQEGLKYCFDYISQKLKSWVYHPPFLILYFFLKIKNKKSHHFLLRFSYYLGSNKPLQDINFENHPEFWTLKKRNIYRWRALDKWIKLSQADRRKLEQEMKNIHIKLQKYVYWVFDIMNGAHDLGNQFLMHLRYDPKLHCPASHNQYTSTFEGFLLFS